MGLETATYIHELDPANPVGGADPKSQGDDHIRLTKQVLQNTLPNVEGEVTVTHTQLNSLANIVSGSYTPTFANASGGVSAVTPGLATYMRIGDIVHVAGLVTFTCTTPALHTFNLSLPVASNLGAQADLAGTASPYGGGAINAGMSGDAANNAAQFSAAVAASTYNMAYTYSYRVLA